MISASRSSLILKHLFPLSAKQQIVCILLFLIFACPSTIAGQRTQPQARPTPPSDEIIDDDDDVVRVDTDLVHVDVAVTDASGQTVRNLRAEDFKLYEDGVERPITSQKSCAFVLRISLKIDAHSLVLCCPTKCLWRT